MQLSAPNATMTASNATASISTDSLFATAFSLWNVVLASPAFRDGVKLFILGGSIESARRLLSLGWNNFVESFFLTAEFEDRDDTYSEFCLFLARLLLYEHLNF